MVDYKTVFVNTNGVNFPDTEAINVTAPGAGDGTEFVALMVNDAWGRAQALMDYAGLTPDGVTEAPDTAQFLEALGKGYGIGPGIGVTYWKNGSPAANGDRVLLLQGQVVLIASYPLLVAACYVGDPNNPTAPAFYKTSDAGGTIRSTAGTYFVLPDHRGLSPKNIGDATISARTKTGPVNIGELQEDQLENITGEWQEVNTNIGPVRSDLSPSFVGAMKQGSFVTANGPVITTTGVGAGLGFDASLIARTGINTRDSSIGTNFGITY